jgi:primase-polymerase (primpol)-like protein
MGGVSAISVTLFESGTSRKGVIRGEVSSMSSIPSELRALRQWVVWRLEQRGSSGKPSKVPYRIDGRRASSTNPDDWTTYDRALTAMSGFSGIGFVFREGGGIAGIDLDHVIGEDGQIEQGAERIVRAFDSYTEYSVSGQGLHIICLGSIPDGRGRRRERCEIYNRSRYFTMSGQVYGEARPLRDAQREIDKLLTWMEQSRKQHSVATPGASKPQYTGRRRYLNNCEVLEKARNARNGEKFRSLFDHGITACYQSHSEADLALISMLLYWTDGDEDRTNELFRQSALYRQKWDRIDYRQHCFSYLNGGVMAHAG